MKDGAMAQVRIFGGSVFGSSPLTSSLYYPQSNMQNSADALRAQKIDLTTMKWGDYQELLFPLAKWPSDTGLKWYQLRDAARKQLSGQNNASPLSPDEPDNFPKTKCDRLDAAIRKCFNSQPAIPIQIDVLDKQKGSPDEGLHDIILDWEYANGKDAPPTLLKFTMLCPAIPIEMNI
jgi:hypothetical protein